MNFLSFFLFSSAFLGFRLKVSLVCSCRHWAGIFDGIQFPRSCGCHFVLKASLLFHAFFVSMSLLLANQFLPTDSPAVTLTTTAIPPPDPRLGKPLTTVTHSACPSRPPIVPHELEVVEEDEIARWEQ